MKLGETVSIRVGRKKQVAFGVLQHVDANGNAMVVIGDKKYLRSLKRVKPRQAGKRENAQKAMLAFLRRGPR